MKRFLAIALFAPTAAFAHPGDHSGLSVQQVVAHITSEPDQVALIVAALAAGAYLIYRTRERK